MHDVNLNQLYYFYITASEGSVTRAAKVLNITQPSVSAQIKALEESVGVDLFERKYRKIELTAEGRRFFGKCERIFRLTEDLFQDWHTDSTGRDLLRIGVVPSVPADLIRSFTQPLLAEQTNLVDMIQSPLERLFELLEDDAVDVIISPSAERVKRRFLSRSLGDQAVMVVGPPGSKPPPGKFPQCLNRQPYVALNRDHGIQEDIHYTLQQANVQPYTVFNAHQLTAAINLVARGQGFGILPIDAVKERLRTKYLSKWGELPGYKVRYFATSRRASSHATLIARLVSRYNRTKQKDGSSGNQV